jgi:hypothetical protein
VGEEADGQAAKADKETKRATSRRARVQKTEGPTILTRVVRNRVTVPASQLQ